MKLIWISSFAMGALMLTAHFIILGKEPNSDDLWVIKKETTLMKRKEILPKWIRFFSWIFLMFAFAPLLFVFGLLIEGSYSLNAFGLSYTGTNTLHPVALYITGILTLASVVSYGILWGKNWGIKLGIIYSYISLTTILFVFVVSFNRGTVYIPLEPILLIPFLVILTKKRKEWDNFDDTTATEDNKVEPVEIAKT